MKNKLRVLVSITLLLCCVNLKVSAGLVRAGDGKGCLLTRNLSLDQLVKSSGLIFKGKLDSIENTTHNLIHVRKLHFTVLESLKGLEPGTKELVLQEWAQVDSPILNEVKLGEVYVFCFHKPSALGLTSLVGLEQGLASLDAAGNISFSSKLFMKPAAPQSSITQEAKLFKVSTDNSPQTSEPNIKSYEDFKNFVRSK
jgi:hypothetical protein